MWRVILYLVLFGIAAYGAIWLAEHPETISFTWAGREYSTSLAIGVVAIVALAMALSLVWAIVRFLARMPGTLGRGRRERRRSRGLKALSRGIVAVGSGDVTAARRFAAEAERLVGHEPLALLLKAQAAQASGDRAGAETAFRRMTEVSETRVLGLRGLYVEASRRGDPEAARAHAAEAARIAPAIAWANDAVLEGHSAAGEWSAATALVERRTSLGLIDRATSHRQRAVLRTADALALDEAGQVEPALAAALDAVRLAPDLVPAAALAGRLLGRKGDLKRAAKIVEGAWRTQQHPDLAAAYLNLRPGDSATDRLRRAETLARLSGWSTESRLAIARAAIDARQPDRARSVLSPLLEGRPTMRVCLMMAELEGVAGQAGRVREWLARAARAPRDPAWIADGIVSERWAPVSPATGRLDAFVWETPPEVLGAPGDIELPPMGDPDPLPALAGPIVAPDLPDPPAPESATGPGMEPEPDPALSDVSAEALSALPAEPAAPAQPDPLAPPEPASAEPIGSEALRRSLANGAGRPRGTPGREPEPVVFPVPRAPDDPGPEGRDDSRHPRFRLRG